MNSNPNGAGQQFFYTTGRAVIADGVVRILSTTTNSSTPTVPWYSKRAQGTALRGTASAATYCDVFNADQTDNCCDPTGGATNTTTPPTVGSLTLTTTVRAWADHFQDSGKVTTTAFEEQPISASDANNLANICFQTVATGNGVCNCGNEFHAEQYLGGQGTGGDGSD